MRIRETKSALLNHFLLEAFSAKIESVEQCQEGWKKWDS